MAYTQKDGTGSLFKNKKKETDKHPDYTGKYKHHDGQEFWISAWVKTGKQGSFLSFATKAIDSVPPNEPDDLPF